MTILALTSLIALAAADPASPSVVPTRVRWCSALLELGRQAPAPREDVVATLAAARASIVKRIRELDASDDRQTEASRTEQTEAHHRPVRHNLGRESAFERPHSLRLAHGRLTQMIDDFESTAPGFAARIDVGRDRIAEFLTSLARNAQEGQDASGEFENGIPPFNARAYARYVRNLAVVGAMSVGFGGAALYALEDQARLGVTAFLGGAAVMSLRGVWDVSRHYRRARSSAEARIRIENADIDRVDVELDTVDRLLKIVGGPRAHPDTFVHHGYSLHVPEETLIDLRTGRTAVRGLSRRPLRLRRGKYTILIDFTLFENSAGELALISAVRTKLTRDLPRTFGNSRVVGDL